MTGIHHELSNAHTPEQNGKAERMNRTIIERAKCMLFDADLDDSYWAEACNMAMHLINRSVCKALVDKTPEEVWTGKKMDVSHLKIFGSPVMVHIPKQRRTKWKSKSEKHIFVGYASEKKGFRCINPKTKQVTISRDVIFDERPMKSSDTFDFAIDEMVTDTNSDTNETIVDTNQVREIDTSVVNDSNQIATDSTIIEQRETSSIEAESPNVVRATNSSCSENDQFESFASERENSKSDDSDLDEAGSEDTLRELDDNNDPDFQTRAKLPTGLRQSTRNRKQREVYDGYVSHLAYFNNSFDPTSVNDALKRDDVKEWKRAMDEEMCSLKENDTWTLVNLPVGRKAIKTKWVFTTKKNDDGCIVRYKARFVAKGCAQKYGLDYHDTFSPVVRYPTIRFLIALAAKKGLKIDQMDAVSAFLQGNLDEEIYIEQPEGFSDGTPRVGKLNRAMYGLKQAGRQWNRKLEDALKSFGLKKSKLDPCIFYNHNLDLIVVIYVDDILIFWRDPKTLAKIKSSLSSTFKMKDLGTATHCIGVRIKQTNEYIEIDQTTYINEILERFRMENSKPVATPSDTNVKLSKDLGKSDEVNDEELKKIPYQAAVGCLLYLTQWSRPDIAFAVNDVSRFNSNYRFSHWIAVKRILRYLNGTKNLRLRYTKGGKNELH